LHCDQSVLHVWRFAPLHLPMRKWQKMQRWHQPSDPLQKCQFSGIEGASRRHQNADSAVTAGQSASQFSGKYANYAKVANHFQYLLQAINPIHN